MNSSPAASPARCRQFFPMQKLYIFLLALFCIKISTGQPVYKKLKVDSLKLGSLKFDKPLVYRNDSTQFVVESAKFRENLIEAIQYYEEIKHPGMNNTSSHRKIVRRSIKKLNSVIKTLDNQATKSDTVFISQITLDWSLHPSTRINWFITKEIDSLTCMIVDSKNVYRNIIIREKAQWTAITGGRRYYFPNEKAPFIIFRDWAQ